MEYGEISKKHRTLGNKHIRLIVKKETIITDVFSDISNVQKTMSFEQGNWMEISIFQIEIVLLCVDVMDATEREIQIFQLL